MEDKKPTIRVRKAVRRGVNKWADTPTGQERLRAERFSKVRDEIRSKSHGGSAVATKSERDDALDHIEALLESPLGKAWIDGGADLISGTGVEIDGPRAPGVVAPLPRRSRIGSPLEQSASVPPMARSVKFEAGFFTTLIRIFVWYSAMFKYMWAVTRDAMGGDNSIATRALRLRETLEGLGPTFIKLGQQLALRADMLPYEYCSELGKLLDNVKPFPTEQAIEAIERAAGRPIGDIFAVFDPEPIGSASLACVYQALMHDGRRVAVKVRRPGIGKMLAADIQALDWLFRIAEGLTIQKPGSTKGFRYDMKSMLMEELNFWAEARATELFRLRARQMKARIVSAPRVFFDLSGEDVLVTEFVSGVFLYEVLNAIDRKDEAALAQLKQRGIDPKKIAANMLMAFNWETLEGLLFHADPHPANVVVRPDNSLVFIDFGSCGRFSQKTRRIYLQFYNHIVREDVSAMVDSSIAMLEPLPPIDMDAFSKELEAVYWDWLYALKSEHAEWWEKATGVIWMRITEISQRYNIGMNLDTLRQFRATFLYDTIIYRLYDGLAFDDEMSKYFRRVGRRARRRFKKSFAERWEKGLKDTDYVVLEEVARMSSSVASLVQRFIDKPRHSFSALVDKAAYSFRMVIQLAAIFAVIHASSIFGHWVYSFLTGQQTSVLQTFEKFLAHPLYQVMLYVVVLLVIRKILLRLGEVDIK